MRGRTAAAKQEPSPSRWSIGTLAFMILLSAFLLFQVQPMLSKAILPWFGGSPAVWTTCLLFFQTLLLCGYVYAHLLQRWLAPRHQVAVHLVLVLAALVMLPVGPDASWKPLEDSNLTWRILLLLAATAGLPYFALSATSPLVQAWFSSVCPGRSPYRLYALSNLGSLAALVSYPFLFEPAFDLPRQSALWSGAFVLYGALCVASVVCLWRLYHADSRAGDSPLRGNSNIADAANLGPIPSAWDRVLWLALSACGSLMLLAATNHICQDVAVVPFLWVMPLAIYLFSFIVSFDHPRWYIRPVWAAGAIWGLLGASINDCLAETSSTLSLSAELRVYLGALLCTCMVCHGELARRKPGPRWLTEFYLLIAAGGVLGSLFVAIVAPLLFSSYLEWYIGVVVSLVMCVGLLALPGANRRRPLYRRLCYGAFGLTVVVGLGYLANRSQSFHGTLERTRNFFGVVSVEEKYADDPAMHVYILKNGRIAHGRQFVDPAKQRWATSYYGQPSGVGRAIEYLQKSGPLRVGAIGLGAGTLAAYARPEDEFRFYEINPDVARIARERFTFLPDCRGKCEVVLGDARLSLEAEPPQKFRLLVLDAFTGDAIPVHLLTREAFDVYMRHLTPDGVIAVHISNRYINLAPVVRRLAEHCQMQTTQIKSDADGTRMLDASDWILMTRDGDFLRANPPLPPTPQNVGPQSPLWTDQYSNLFQILGSQ